MKELDPEVVTAIKREMTEESMLVQKAVLEGIRESGILEELSKVLGNLESHLAQNVIDGDVRGKIVEMYAEHLIKGGKENG